MQITENIKAPRHCPLTGNSPVTGEFPAQRSSNTENMSIRQHYHEHGLPMPFAESRLISFIQRPRG